MIHWQQGLDLTGSNKQDKKDDRRLVEDMTPTEHVCAAYGDKIYCFAAIGNENENMIYSDHTGQFPVRSFDGMVYFL